MNLQFKVNKSIDEVFDIITDMQKFASVHPVINKIDRLAENKYLVSETLKVGFIPFNFRYPVTIEKNVEDNTVTMKATVMKLVYIDMGFILFQDGSSTKVDESIKFRSILPVGFIMKKVFREQHELLFKNINDQNEI